MTNKLRVGIVFGGRSAEHQVSLQSAKSIFQAIDKERYEPVLIGITEEGDWLLNEASEFLLNSDDPKLIALNDQGTQVSLVASRNRGQLLPTLNDAESDGQAIDVLFPVLHGPYGEDGSIQGLAKLANLPCVGSGILGSSVSMDKDFTKRLLKLEDIHIANYCIVRNGVVNDETLERIEQELRYPVFVKPANLGSSIGVKRVDDRMALLDAIGFANQYDPKVLIEEAILGRELECAVLGNDDPIVSIVGEIKAANHFYDYDSKYIDDNAAELIIPAPLDEAQQMSIQSIARKVYRLLECRGMARIDMFLTEQNEIYINEVNTIPGFTRISMYPKLFDESGISYPELIDQLIQLAIEDFRP